MQADGARSATNEVSKASVAGREGVTILETLYRSVRNLTVRQKNLGRFCVLERTELWTELRIDLAGQVGGRYMGTRRREEDRRAWSGRIVGADRNEVRP